ncbi:hemolysin III family protein [Spongisporangium articulatum]|uniref:Hemolysin III family protein n=1 Tax=Spongisporangium articulatum TaxID=3362603 RepID=A0ABW8AR75_9ACTN
MGEVERENERTGENPPERLVGRLEDRLGQAHQTVREVKDQVREKAELAQQTVREKAELVKPKLRGWLHAGTFPLAVTLGAVLVLVSPEGRVRVASAVFAVTASLLFGVSALYHRGHWSPRTTRLLKRMDHANIFLIIAGTYTPFSVLLLAPGPARTLLWIVWSGALAGVAFRVLWVGAPRWLYVPVYIALGWVAVVYLPEFWAAPGHAVAIVTLILVGGLFYTVGAIIYGTKRPNPSPRWFGFHELFHAFTVAAFLAHWVGAAIAVGSVPS